MRGSLPLLFPSRARRVPETSLDRQLWGYNMGQTERSPLFAVPQEGSSLETPHSKESGSFCLHCAL
jgi:hypothetical protein